MLHTKIYRKKLRGRLRTRWIDQIRKDKKLKGKIGKKYRETKNGRIEVTGDFCVIVDPYLWKWRKNDNDD